MTYVPASEEIEEDFYDEDRIYDDDFYDEIDEVEANCALRHDGQCGLAGSEYCDWRCPMRNTEFYAGSAAWIEKHRKIHRRRVMRRYT